MRTLVTAALVLVIILAAGAAGSEDGNGEMDDYRELTPFEESVIVHRSTEAPFSGEYVDEFSEGTYFCKRCGSALYNSDSKFHSGCGWPSFDSEIEGAVERRPDPDGNRTEIVCANCGGHLGHVFEGEGFTPLDTRHCVNSVSLLFVPEERQERAAFAGGCFWGVEHQLKQVEGVLETTVGYTGGETENPEYRHVCSGTTGHAEAVEVIFDNSLVTFEELARLFFEIHDPTTPDRQGVDVGSQYRSAVFYTTDDQLETLQQLKDELRDNGYDPVTQLQPLDQFWPAEDYHQDYYSKSGGSSMCHVRTDRFGD
ncbi:MAG: bifunctional methionine sulfoxide reductase B/A protein [Candidatus Aegiribacteria sp.]|nr:bifunctional methionine sulfoxide reductase B/A protein [Candidatus Aegiribacteria sp.]MBD3294203.1 bifunctional methionine sulfoxide reductase B/A protein [Candidatus Fermentibacteria bacterium]